MCRLKDFVLLVPVLVFYFPALLLPTNRENKCTSFQLIHYYYYLCRFYGSQIGPYVLFSFLSSNGGSIRLNPSKITSTTDAQNSPSKSSLIDIVSVLIPSWLA